MKIHSYSKTTVQIDIPQNINVHFKVGLLNITNIENTEFPSGINQHMVIYIEQNNKVIVWGYLTSQVQGNLELSKAKPFSEDSNLESSTLVEPSKSKTDGQYLHILDKPLLVSDESIQSMPHYVEGTKPHHPIKTNQEIAHEYINKPEILYQLSQIFDNKVRALFNNPINIYDGKGVTAEHIDYVLKAHDLYVEQEADRYFKLYKNSKVNKSQVIRDTWFTSVTKEKPTDTEVHARLKEKIDQYHAKHKK